MGVRERRHVACLSSGLQGSPRPRVFLTSIASALLLNRHRFHFDPRPQPSTRISPRPPEPARFPLLETIRVSPNGLTAQAGMLSSTWSHVLRLLPYIPSSLTPSPSLQQAWCPLGRKDETVWNSLELRGHPGLPPT